MIRILFVKETKAGDEDNIFELVECSLIAYEISLNDSDYDEDVPQETVNFNLSYEGIEFILSAEKRTANNTIVLLLNLSVASKNIDILDSRISSLKFLIKDSLIDEFSKCYWVYDEQVMKYSQEIYLAINKAENLFRSFVVNYMVLNHGINWWECVAKHIKSKKEDRIEGYAGVLTDFKGINVDLLSIDIGDLASLVENEYSVKIEFNCTSSKEVPEEQLELKKILRGQLNKCLDEDLNVECKMLNSFWGTGLAKFFGNPEDFKKKWDRLCKNRNHIAHNKLIDENMYKIIMADNDYIIRQLQIGSGKLKKSVKSKEDVQFYEYIQRTTKQSDLANYGSKIYSIDDIKEELLTYIQQNILKPADDILYFGNSIATYHVNEEMELSYDTKLIEVENHEGETFRVDIIDFDINDYEGEQSFIKFEINCTGNVQRFSLCFGNTVIEKDDTGTYIPVFEGGINDSEFSHYDNKSGYTNIILDELRSFVN